MLKELYGKNMNLNVYYVGPFDFPNGGAAARRILGNINTLKSIGINVKVVDGKTIVNTSLQQGVEVASIGERPDSKDNVFKKLSGYLFIGNKTVKHLQSQEFKPDVIILYSGYSPYLLRLLNYCRKNNIKLIFDCVEWYAPASLFGYLKPYYWNIEFAMRFLVPRCNGVICISKYLESYYENRTQVSRIPPTLSVSTMPEKESYCMDLTLNPIKLVYTGNPGHKDKLQQIVNVVSELPGYELHIAGIERENTNNVFYYGHLTYERAVELVSQSHFSILLRPNNIISKAGFSTKVVESLSCGTPVITNNTGDLSSVIHDGVNGFIFDGTKPEQLKNKLSSILSDININYAEMSYAAKQTAFDTFDYRLYKNELLRLFN
jgi:glycosyltransferase involved in cell wall biosynthesis